MKNIRVIIFSFLLLASSAYAQTVHHFHAVLRANAAGVWFIQNDVDHAPYGIDLAHFYQFPDRLVLYLNPVGAKAGYVHISSDDGFAGSIIGNANLGTQNVTIWLRAAPYQRHSDAPINPSAIWSYVNFGNGNLWVSGSVLTYP